VRRHNVGGREVATGRRATPSLSQCVLHDDWNPIGFRMPDDEYTTYAGTVGRMLHEGRSVSDIASYLGSAREHMGLHREPEDDRGDERVAASLVRWYVNARR
jgi:hypothetical protein